MVKGKCINILISVVNTLVEFRLSYALWMLQQFEKEISGKSIKLYLMYDIACVLDTHMQIGCCTESALYAIIINTYIFRG